ncbi:MAG TPA: hypothetical protein VMF30_07965 [Pirellulales bacterium]|nr:hypothetical protein [Pirellulales bacterium]
MTEMSPFDHVWYWRVRLPERKDAPCRVVARGAKNSVLVEFTDGQRVVTSRYAVRKAKPREKGVGSLFP